MEPRKVRIGVVGAGIIGMSCAYRLQTELPNTQVTVVSKDFTPNLTSDGAAGIWEVYDFFNTDTAKIERWAMDTYEHLKVIALSFENITAGVSFLKLTIMSRKNPQLIPWYADKVDHYKKLSKEELQAVDPTCVRGHTYSSLTCEPKIYLPWITKKYINAGGKIVKREVTDLTKFCEDYDLVVNCPGLMASTLNNDTDMYPTRGQVLKVTGVTLLNSIFYDATYIIPGRDCIVLGGTFEDHNGSTKVNEKQKDEILRSCCKLEPSLKNGKIEQVWCGLRPSRKSGVRLEVDDTYHPTTKVIHNYGHGGIGITLHWGCAADVLHLALQCVQFSRSKL